MAHPYFAHRKTRGSVDRNCSGISVVLLDDCCRHYALRFPYPVVLVIIGFGSVQHSVVPVGAISIAAGEALIRVSRFFQYRIKPVPAGAVDSYSN